MKETETKGNSKISTQRDLCGRFSQLDVYVYLYIGNIDESCRYTRCFRALPR